MRLAGLPAILATIAGFVVAGVVGFGIAFGMGLLFAWIRSTETGSYLGAAVVLAVVSLLGLVVIQEVVERLLDRFVGGPPYPELARSEHELWADCPEPPDLDRRTLGWVVLWFLVLAGAFYARQWGGFAAILLVGFAAEWMSRNQFRFYVTTARVVIASRFPRPKHVFIEIASLDHISLAELPGGLGTLTLVVSVTSDAAPGVRHHRLPRLKEAAKAKNLIESTKEVLAVIACECMQPTQWRCEEDGRSLGTDMTNGRYGEVWLHPCDKCGRHWLFYRVEYESFSESGRWYRALIPPEVAKTVTAETAAAALAASEYRVFGGSYFRVAGRAVLGPGYMPVDI